MSDNNFFVWWRFAAYLRKLWVEQWRVTLMRTIVLFAVCILAVFWMALTVYPKSYSGVSYRNAEDPIYKVESIFIIVVLFVYGCFMSSQLLAGARRKAARISTFTLPVTPFEMFTARWMMSVPMFMVTFFGCFYAADLLRVALFAPIFGDFDIAPYTPYVSFYDIMIFFNLCAIYLCLWSLYILGSVLFVRRPLIMTSVALFILFWVILFIGMSVEGWLFFDISLQTNIVLWLYALFFVYACHHIAYLRFKELDVIDSL